MDQSDSICCNIPLSNGQLFSDAMTDEIIQDGDPKEILVPGPARYHRRHVLHATPIYAARAPSLSECS